jgi:protein CpxP
MHRLILPSALSLAFATALVGSLAFAQTPQAASDQAAVTAPAKTPNPHHQAMQLAKQLNLSPDQTAKLEPILADRDSKLAALNADTSLDAKSVKKQKHAIAQSAQQQMSSVLTPAQLDQLKSLHHGQSTKQPLMPTPAA